MKARLADAPPPGSWNYEIKFDGWRALAMKGSDGISLVSRNLTNLAVKFPEIVEGLEKVKGTDFLIDGEIVALDEHGRPSFQLLQAYDMGDERPPLFYYAFDLPRWNGQDLRAQPLEQRRSQLEKLIPRNSLIRFSASLGGDADSLLKQARKLGLEGFIGKRTGSPYEPGQRSGAWIKLKVHNEQEFVIGGHTPPGGSRQHFGSLIVGYYEKGKLLCAGKVGTGFNEKLLAELHGRLDRLETDRCPFVNLPAGSAGRWGQGITATEMKHCTWVKPVLVCQIKFHEWTRDGRLRQPVFVGLREDKPAKSVVREKSS